MKKKTSEQIIEEIKEKIGDKYDYSKVEYLGSKMPMTFICKKHGEFKMRYDHIIHGSGCPKCALEHKMCSKSEFIKRAKEIHGWKYEYLNLDDFMPCSKILLIKCKKHGIFKQSLNSHLNAKQGCSKCYHESRINKTKLTTEDFIKEAKKVHGDKYDYSITKYIGSNKKIQYICPKHGIISQLAHSHLKGFKCKYCKHDEDRLTKEEFIEKAKKIHGNKYDYSNIKYVNNHTPIELVCKIHGPFKILPSRHLYGAECQKCNYSKLENEINVLLKNNNINFISQANCQQLPWLNRLTLDFYLPDCNIAIECQGKQHFEPVEFFGGKSDYQDTIERDERKRNLCEKNGIKLLYFSNLGIKYPYKVFEDENLLLEEIKKEGK